MMDFKVILFLVAVLPPYVNCMRKYQELIPNGHNVLDPCNPTTFWQGVGHMNPAGAGPRNKFGQDFAAHHHHWTVDLCNDDSDGDGDSNGLELGDPYCEWRPGTVPNHAPKGHPGFCVQSPEQNCNHNPNTIHCAES